MKSTANQRKWTVMICLAGDNNLSAEMIYNIKELKRVEKISPIGPVTVVALFDPANGLPTQGYVVKPGDVDNQLIKEADLVGVVKGTKPGAPAQVKVVPSSFATTLAENVLAKPGTKLSSLNTGDPHTLAQAINIYLNAYPAEHYLLVLSGHGSGAEQDFLLTDDGAKDSLNINELKELISEVKRNLSENQDNRKIDILGLDSCLMSMAEIYYQLGNVSRLASGKKNVAKSSNLVDFLVGSEGFVRNTGWPYQRVLTTLADNPEMLPETFAEKIVRDYILYYADYALAGLSVDIAACDLRENNCILLKDAVADLARTLRKNLKNDKIRDEILLAHWEAQTYKFDLYTDLADFCKLLAKRCKKYKDIKKACNAIVKVIEKNVVKKSCYTGSAVQFSFGLSVYFPWSQVSKEYGKLKFVEDTQWDKFLEEYVKRTRRPSRKNCSGNSSPVEALVRNPSPNEFPDLPVPQNAKFVLPENQGPGGGGASLKNPPLNWCPDHCVEEA